MVSDRYDVKKDKERIDEARAAGFDIVESTPTTLLLDLDDNTAKVRFIAMYPMVSEKYPIAKMEAWTSKSGQGAHVVLHLRDALEVGVRVALQAVLGSDAKRETLALYRYTESIRTEPSLLFRPPHAIIFTVNPNSVSGHILPPVTPFVVEPTPAPELP